MQTVRLPREASGCATGRRACCILSGLMRPTLRDLEHELVRLEHTPLGRRLFTITLASTVHAVLYFSANHWPLREPRLLRFTALDELIPFVPATSVVYVSAYVLAFVGFLSLRRASEMRRYLEVFITCVLVAGLVHWLMPTRYPRELFPLSGDGWGARLLGAVRSVDTPNSCLPSLHVALATVAAFLVRRDRPRWVLPLALWALAIAASTLTTKQHYVVDVVSGFGLATVAVFLVEAIDARRLRAKFAARHLASAAHVDTARRLQSRGA